jgi:predicted permease
MGELFRRLRYLLSRRRLDRELENDMEFHREMAAREGKKNFGNVLRLREESREAWGWTWIDRLLQDLGYGVRMLRRSPGFTLTAVLVLAVGIGVNVAAFSFFNVVMLQPLPIRDPETVVRLQRRSPDASTNVMSYPQMAFYRGHAKTLQAVMGTMGERIAVDDDMQPVGGTFITENYFTELGARAAYGRLLDPARDGAADSPPVVVLSYEFWQRRFGSDPSIVGRTIRLNKKSTTVVGVTADDFIALADAHPNLWLPISQVSYFVEGSKALTDAGLGSVEMWGRLAPKINATMAEQELLALTNEYRKLHPKEVWDKEYVRSDPGGHFTVANGEADLVLAMMGTLAMLILAVACANLGGLLTARSVTREHEIEIRVAVGAGKLRIFRQLVTESLLLATLGSIAGLALGYVVLRVGMAESSAPMLMSATPDRRVLLFVVGLTLVTTLLFGLAPAFQMTRRRQRRTTARQVLVAVQIAASCVLLIVSGLLVRAAQHVLTTDPGFGYEQVVSIDPGLGGHGVTAAVAGAFLDQFASRLRSLPAVTSVSLSSVSPLGHERVAVITNEISGRKVPIYPFQVSPEFFQTMGIPLVRGRNLLPGEKNAVIVSESLARMQWPGEDPLGKLDASGSSKGEVVVGVVRGARLLALNNDDAVELYRAVQPEDMPNMYVLVKTAGAADGLVPAVRSIGESLDPKLFLYIQLLKGEFRRATQGVAMAAMAISALGLVALSLAALGLVGLVAYAVAERTKEIAIRIALGARPWDVLSSILRQFFLPVMLGLLAGALATAAFSKLLRQVLYGVSNLDPVSYVGAVGFLACIAIVAALLPARRALRVDPMRALHTE